ncbi:hypothetical protein [Cognatishimia sp. F0-27]|uniref:hypothetical protein n=1 Tax=Cognatishimia sp. F0-27 TaxID=2816855 RepID=UPI001D0C30CF|nr:hypothetical protein [Cognatishimia sp. F0-27]MCC1493357.1 hypothetical protein [Cognatishimia sp. F0-27]
MLNTVSTLQQRLSQRLHYHRTVRALRAMPLEVALDLDIDPSDAERIARQAVYRR